MVRSVFGLVFYASTAVTAAWAQPLTFIEDRMFESNHGFMIAIPLGVTACRGGWTDHGFFLFLGSKAPCVRSQDVKEDEVPWIVESTPEESIPYIQFSYFWNAAFSPESAWEIVEQYCQNKKYPERGEEAYGSRMRVSPYRFLGHPGIECVRKYRPTNRISMLIQFHPFALSGHPDTDDDGYVVPYGHYSVVLVTTAAEFEKHRKILQQVFNAIAWPSGPDTKP